MVQVVTDSTIYLPAFHQIFYKYQFFKFNNFTLVFDPVALIKYQAIFVHAIGDEYDEVFQMTTTKGYTYFSVLLTTEDTRCTAEPVIAVHATHKNH